MGSSLHGHVFLMVILLSAHYRLNSWKIDQQDIMSKRDESIYMAKVDGQHGSSHTSNEELKMDLMD